MYLGMIDEKASAPDLFPPETRCIFSPDPPQLRKALPFKQEIKAMELNPSPHSLFTSLVSAYRIVSAYQRPTPLSLDTLDQKAVEGK